MTSDAPGVHSRRSVIAAVGAILAGAGIAPWWHRASADNTAMPASEPGARNSADNAEIEILLVMPPTVTLLGRGATRAGDTLATTSVGKPVSLTVQVTVPPWSRVLRAIVAVASPGSVSGAFNPASAPEQAAMRPERHLAASEPLTDATADTYNLTVSFDPAQPGTYPVFYLDQIIQASSRKQAAPRADSGARVHDGSAELGNIIVN